MRCINRVYTATIRKKVIIFIAKLSQIRYNSSVIVIFNTLLMKNQKGFTLVELMVVMAIIAILSTAGISQYGKFIKAARDTTRVADLNALNIVILDSIQAQGTVPDDVDALKLKIKEVAGKYIQDPLTGKTACLDGASSATTVACEYQYATCDGGTGYILATSFESKNNVDNKYAKDDVSTSGGGSYVPDADLYEIGSCNEVLAALEVIPGA
jgi:prepilin-type N-terminal cleavage/methylation domain-containing protein